MRVLDTTTFQLHAGDQLQFKNDGYAILSHRWGEREVTFSQLDAHVDELRTGAAPLSTPALDKIRGACEVAREQHGLRWMWIDSCCINKTSTVEETESIVSMFKWYRDAKVCLTYLWDVTKKPTADRSRSAATSPAIFQRTGCPEKLSEWFERGWTLQELLAPRAMVFYDGCWTELGTKASLAPELERATGIGARYLTGADRFEKASIAAKMSWMAGRVTGRGEDIAYSMLGIFDVALLPQYGEGKLRAFMRLQHALLAKSTDESIFAWRMPDEPEAAKKYNNAAKGSWESGEWGLLAPTPEWFCDSGRVVADPEDEKVQRIARPNGGFFMAQQGLQVSMAPIEWTNAAWVWADLSMLVLAGATVVGLVGYFAYRRRKLKGDGKFTLNCWERDDRGNLAAVRIYVRPLALEPTRMVKRIRCQEYRLHRGKIKFADPQVAIVVQPEVAEV